MAKKTKNLQIPIFKAEQDAGLASAIQANASIAYVTKLENTELSQEVAAEFLRSAAAEEPYDEKQFDLFYLNTILVTTGWNKNTDIFTKEEVWGARYTPIHKQFNLGHDQSKIIGHMTTAKAVDDKFAVISDDTSIDELPAKFHILTGAVIYRALSDPDAQAQIEQIIEEIAEGKWYVSMECLFRGFDYGLTSASGEQRVLPRNEETAFLTKHLRQYGGAGSYQGFALGRCLKNITFSGKGLVETPANPESIIFNEAVAEFKATFANLGYINANASNDLIISNISSLSSPKKEVPIMADTPNTSVVEAQLADALTKIKDLEVKLNEKETVAVTAKITGLESEVATKQAKLVELETEIAALKTSVTDLTAKLTASEAAVATATTELAAIKAAEVTRARVASLVALHAPEAEATQIVAMFDDKDDEQFKTLAGLFSGKWVAPAAPAVPAAASTPAPKKDKPAVAAPVVADDVLDDAVVEDDDAALAASTVNDEVEPLRAAMAEVFAFNLKKVKTA